MNNIGDVNPINRHEQISLAGLERLAQVASTAASPQLNGYGYSSAVGTAIVQTGQDAGEITGLLLLYNNSQDSDAYPNFPATAFAQLAVAGDMGLTLSITAGPNVQATLDILPASLTQNGVITAGAAGSAPQQIAGPKYFNETLEVYSSILVDGMNVLYAGELAGIFLGPPSYETFFTLSNTTEPYNGSAFYCQVGGVIQVALNTPAVTAPGTPPIVGTWIVLNAYVSLNGPLTNVNSDLNINARVLLNSVPAWNGTFITGDGRTVTVKQGVIANVA